VMKMKRFLNAKRFCLLGYTLCLVLVFTSCQRLGIAITTQDVTEIPSETVTSVPVTVPWAAEQSRVVVAEVFTFDE
jgi:hypothetical protein